MKIIDPETKLETELETKLYKEVLGIQMCIRENKDCYWLIFDVICAAIIWNELHTIKYLVSLEVDLLKKNNRPLQTAVNLGMFNIANYLITKGADYNKLTTREKDYNVFTMYCMDLSKDLCLQFKYYKRWRKFVLKNFVRKVIIPLYYSPEFPGGEKEMKEMEKFTCFF